MLDTPVVTGGNQIMPRSTMPARGLRDTAPFHWDGIPGDPYGGIHSASIRTSVAANSRVDPPTSATRHLIDGGLASTMHLVGDASRNEEGKVGELTAQERDDMAAYLLGVSYPPAPKRAYSDRLSERAKSGFRLFHVDGDHDPKQPTPNVCGNCHRMPFLVSTNTPGTGMDAPTWRGAQDRWLILPQGRLNIIAFDFYHSIAERGAPEREIWRLSWAYRQRFDPVWDMVVEMSTGFSGAFGRQVAMNRNSSALAETNDLLDSLETAATDGAVVLECDGVLLEAGDAKPIALQFSASNGSPVYRNKSKPQIEFTRRQLLELADAGRFTGTVTARHGARASLDHPQPALWTLGPIERQRGRQAFPILHPDRKSMVVSGRHFGDDARLFLDGGRVAGTVRVARVTSATGAVSTNDAANATGAAGATNAVQSTGAAAANAGTKNELRPLAAEERVEITLASLPSVGLHFLQVQAPEGFFSNEFLVHVAQDAEAAEQLERELIRQSNSPWDGLAGAISRGDLAAVKRFATNKETADKRLADGSTPLSAAALRGHLDIAKHLLEVGADPSASNADGNTPLHVAAFLCREELVRLLLSKKAPLDRKNTRGETPLDVVAGAWTPALADFYTGVANSASIKLDHAGLEGARKKMASLLRNP